MQLDVIDRIFLFKNTASSSLILFLHDHDDISHETYDVKQ